MVFLAPSLDDDKASNRGGIVLFPRLPPLLLLKFTAIKHAAHI
jgi:hypothetical protein